MSKGQIITVDFFTFFMQEYWSHYVWVHAMHYELRMNLIRKCLINGINNDLYMAFDFWFYKSVIISYYIICTACGSWIIIGKFDSKSLLVMTNEIRLDWMELKWMDGWMGFFFIFGLMMGCLSWKVIFAICSFVLIIISPSI